MDDKVREFPRLNSVLPRCISTSRAFLILVACYFVLHIGLRLFTSTTIDKDEAEQLVMTQQITWGYGAQPPLYTWLLWPFIKIFGPTILALALFKSVLLFAIYAFTYFNARRILRDHTLAVCAALSLLFVPQISWESQRDLTHSVLVTLCSVLAFHMFLRLTEKQSLSNYVFFGVVAAAGLLSKYSFAIFLVGLFLAAATIPSLRKVVFHPGMLLSVVVCVVLILPSSVWAIQHRELVEVAAKKLTLGDKNLSWSAAVTKGLGRLVGSIFVHTGALIVLYLMTLKARPHETLANDARIQVIWRSLLAIAAILVITILVAGASRFLDRWLMPLCVWLPILAIARARMRLDEKRLKAFFIVVAVLVVGISVAIPVRIRFAEKWKWPQALNVPIDTFSAELRKVTPAPQVIFADSSWLGGNLRQQFPQSLIVCPTVTLPLQPQPGQSCVMIWIATSNAAPDLRFTALCQKWSDVDLSPEKTHQLEATMKYFKHWPARLGFATGTVKSMR